MSHFSFLKWVCRGRVLGFTLVLMGVLALLPGSYGAPSIELVSVRRDLPESEQCETRTECSDDLVKVKMPKDINTQSQIQPRRFGTLHLILALIVIIGGAGLMTFLNYYVCQCTCCSKAPRRNPNTTGHGRV